MVHKRKAWVSPYSLRAVSMSRYDHKVLGVDRKNRLVVIASFTNKDEAETWVMANGIFGRRVYGVTARDAVPGLGHPKEMSQSQEKDL